MPDEITGPVNGAAVEYSGSGGDVYWSWNVDDNIDPAFKLTHRDKSSGTTSLIGSGVKPSSVHVDFGVDGLDGDQLRWKILCLPLNAGTFPVVVQLFQGSEASGFTKLTPVIRYDVTVGGNSPESTINDWIVFKATP
jgi:hypothetical protein